MALTTLTSPEAWRPNVVSTFDANDMLASALIVQSATLAGRVEGDAPVVLVPYVAVDPEAGFVTEGEQIPLDDVGAARIEVSTDKVAVITRVSQEMIAQPGAPQRLALSLRRSVTAKADQAFLNNTGGPIGLFQLADVATAGTLGSDLFAAYDAVAAIEADGGQASHALVNPTDWGALAKLPTAEGSNQSLLADVHDAAARSLAGVPVIVHAAVPRGQALVLDRTEVVAAYGWLELARSEHAFFTMDSVAIRATWRIGWNIVRPARLQKLTIGGGPEPV